MFQMVARTAIKPSPLNPRKHFDPAKIEELAASMGNGVGIIEPLVIRKLAGKGELYELVAGERRWRAAEKAGLTEVPAMVKELTDAQVLELMVIENNQREDISPLEEASGFKQLLDLKAVEIDDLAKRLGRSKKYVYDRMKLLALVAEARQLLDRGKITSGHAILLARLTPDQQKTALDPKRQGYYDGLFERDDDAAPLVKGEKADAYHALRAKPVRSLQSWIVNNCRLDLAAADTREEFPSLFPVVEKAAKVVHISDSYGDAEVEKGAEKILNMYHWKRADGKDGSKKCDLVVTGVFVLGRLRGSVISVCVDRACKVHWKAEQKRAVTNSRPTAPSASEKRWKEQERKREELRASVEKARPQIVAAAIARVPKVKPGLLAALILECDGVNQADFKKGGELLKTKKVDAASVLQQLAAGAIVGRCEYAYEGASLARDLKPLGVDVMAVVKKVQTSAQVAAKKAPAPKATVKKKAVAVVKDLKKKGKAS